MSTHTRPETRHASQIETTVEPDRESDSTGDEDQRPDASYDAHDAAATFDAQSLVRLPNTVDDENKRVG